MGKTSYCDILTCYGHYVTINTKKIETTWKRVLILLPEYTVPMLTAAETQPSPEAGPFLSFLKKEQALRKKTGLSFLLVLVSPPLPPLSF